MNINAIVVLAYLVGTIGFGWYLSRFVKKGEDFFLAGRSLNKWVIAGMIMATNVAAIYLVGPAGAAYAGGGVSVLLIAWTGNMIAAASALFFVPRLRRLEITTVSELIETRYNVGLRLLVSLLWILYYALFAGNAMYTLSTVLSPVLGLSQMQVIWFVSGAVILYCFFSGLMAAAYSSVIQSFLMIIGGLILLPLCLKHPLVGGVSGLTGQLGESAFTFWKSSADIWPNYKHIFMFALLGLPYWCTSQYMLQCSFAGKNVRHAARGLIIAGAITGVLTLSFIIPGMCGTLIYAGDPLSTGDSILPKLLNDVLPVGIGGIIIAALVAASNSTAAALLNAAATLTEHDFYRRFFPNASSKHGIWVGRIAILCCGLFGLVFALQVERLGGIIKANFAIMSFFEPPIFVIVAGALFFRRVNSMGALAAMIGGICLGIYSLQTGMGDETRTFLAFPVCSVLLLIGSMVGNCMHKKQEEELAAAEQFIKRAKGALPLNFGVKTGRIGIGLAIAGLVAFVLVSVFEAHVPIPLNLLCIVAAMLAFVGGCYMAVEVFVPIPEGEDEDAGEEFTGIRGLLASGKSWLALGCIAVILVTVLYLI